MFLIFIAKIDLTSMKFYPTRLIKVDGPSDTDVKVIETSQTNSNGPYITLSHRWSEKVRPASTTTKNLATRLQSLNVSELPKTFRDAFEFVRKLDITQYIWIDSICIVQDDPSDWEREAGSMGKIYSDSFLNLSATGATSSDDGLFLPRDKSLISTDDVYLLIVGRPRQQYHFIDENFWKSRVIEASLNRRGWVVQERVLAPRILHFGKD